MFSPIRNAVRDAYRVQYYPLGYVPALDGMRGVMTLGVVVAHVYYTYVPGTVLYIDVFFTASGYYITSLLLRDIERRGRIDYKEFYKRRFARILPPFALMLAAYVLFHWIFLASFTTALGQAAIAMSYITNWWAMFDPAGISALGHTWTLSVEEQFYLLWPVTFAFIARRFGVSWRLVTAICAIGLAVWGWRAFLVWDGASWQRLYVGLDTRSDALMVGCAMAVALKLVAPGKYPTFDRLMPKLAWPLAIYWVIITFAFWQYAGPIPYPHYYYYYYFGSIICGAIPGALALTMLSRSSGTVCHRIFERPEAVFLGRIFYGIYLWHLPILNLLNTYGFGAKSRLLIGLPLSVIVATLSYAYLERHFMRQRQPSSQKSGFEAHTILARMPPVP
jgi:peptidoglycan/LPS O-acetylase OafA/YrhL